MTLSQRFLPPFALVAAMCVGACKDNPASGENPQASSSAPQGIPPSRAASLATQIKLDPVIAKVYRAEACYYGTLSLRQARTAYLGSLGGAEPSADKLPDFGSPSPEPTLGPKGASPAGSASASPAGSAAPKSAPATSASAAPKAAPKAPPSASASAAKPTGSGAPVAPAGAPDDRAKAASLEKRLRSVPYERFARSCTVAAGIKVPEHADFDAAMAEYAPWVVQLSKDIAMANMYYQREDYKNDGFAKGKEFHQKLTDGFKKLDEMQKKLEKALADLEQKNPYDTQEWPESQKLSFAATDASRDLFVELEADKVDAAKVKAAIEKVEAANAALKKYGDEHKDANDPFVRIVVPSIDIMVKQAREIADRPEGKPIEASDLVAMTTYFTRVLEGNNRGVTRLLAEKEGPPAFGGPHGLPEGHPGMPTPSKP